LDIRKNREYTDPIQPLRPTIGETGTKLHHSEIFHKRFLRKSFEGHGSYVMPKTVGNNALIGTTTRLEATIESIITGAS
jgi:hypothetical protein